MSRVNQIPVVWYPECLPAPYPGVVSETFPQVGGLRFKPLINFLDQHSTADCATEYVLNKNKNGYESWTDGGQRCANDMFNCDNQFISSLFELKV